MFQPKETRCSNSEKKIENFPEDMRVSEAIDDTGFVRKVSLGQYFVTFHYIDSAGFGYSGSCWIRGNTNIA